MNVLKNNTNKKKRILKNITSFFLIFHVQFSELSVFDWKIEFLRPNCTCSQLEWSGIMKLSQNISKLFLYMFFLNSFMGLEVIVVVEKEDVVVVATFTSF